MDSETLYMALHTGTGVGNSYHSEHSLTPGFLDFFRSSFFSVLNWSVPYSRLRPQDTNKANLFSNKVFDVKHLLQFRDATGKTVKKSVKAHRINSPEKVATKHQAMNFFFSFVASSIWEGLIGAANPN